MQDGDFTVLVTCTYSGRTGKRNWTISSTLANLTLPTASALSHEAKNAYLATFLDSEGYQILMAHPVAT